MRPTALLTLGLFVAATAVTVTQRIDPRSAQWPDVELKIVVNRELVDGDLAAAIERYRDIAARYRTEAPSVAARALIQMADSYEKLGRSGIVDARQAYEQIVRDFPGERDAVVRAQARLRRGAQRSGGPGVTLKSVKRDVWIGSVSFDGHYLSSIDPTGNLSVRDLRAGTDRALTQRTDHNLEASAISRDSKFVAYQSYAGCVESAANNTSLSASALCSVSLDGSRAPTPRTIFQSANISYIAPMDWSPDGRSIAVSLKGEDHAAQIGLVTVADGSLHVLQTVDWRGPTRAFLA